MSKVVSLKTGEAASIDARCADVAAMLREVADQAERGEVTAAAIAFVRIDGTIGTLWESSGQVYQTIGAATVLCAEMAGLRVPE